MAIWRHQLLVVCLFRYSVLKAACFGRQGCLEICRYLRGSLAGRPFLRHCNKLQQGPPCSTFFFDKLTVPQPVNKFHAFYATWRFITVFTSAHHLSLTSARLIQSMPYPTSCRSILILSTHLCLGLTNCLLPSGLSTKILYAALLSPIRATSSAHLLDFIAPSRYLWSEVYYCSCMTTGLEPVSPFEGETTVQCRSSWTSSFEISTFRDWLQRIRMKNVTGQSV